MEKRRQVIFEKLLHGGDYNPEQWLQKPQILEKDIEYFKKAGINEVTMGIFSWSALEPEEGVFCFDWMKEIIDRLWANGISVILATPSGARPKWMADKYPEVLRVDPTGHRAFFGARHNHCYTSPVYREKVRIINRKLAEIFGNHPGVIAWHISNEYGGAFDCYCPLCQAEFRAWLKARYREIDTLNQAWATMFWSHSYNSFDQIEAPSPRGEQFLHGLNLDWKRFVTDRTVDFMRHEIQALRDGGTSLPMTTNLQYDYPRLNYHKFVEDLDFVSWNTYPPWHRKAEYLTAMDNGMQHDYMRSLKKLPFHMMESCPTATSWQPVSKLRRPGMHLAASLQAIAHGSDSVLYFQLRQSRGSKEKFHGAVIDHYGGDDTRVFQDVTQVGRALEELRETVGSLTESPVAVIYDQESRWAMEDAMGPRNEGLFYKKAVKKSYYAFRKLGLNVDMIDMEQELEDYAIVAAPMLYMFRAGFEEKARRFVEKGGHLIMTYWSGIVDETDLCFLGGTPHGLMDVLGLRSEEIDGLYDGESNTGVPVEGNSLHLTNTYACTHLCDLVRPEGAEVLMAYGSDFYAGKPVLTCHSFGKGKAYYVCADFEQAFYDEVYRKAAARAGIERIVKHIPEGVEVTSRKSDRAEYLFVQNFNRKAVEISLPTETYPLWLGNYDGTVGEFETVVLRRQLSAT